MMYGVLLGSLRFFAGGIYSAHKSSKPLGLHHAIN
jgi:hypothetical protein